MINLSQIFDSFAIPNIHLFLREKDDTFKTTIIYNTQKLTIMTQTKNLYTRSEATGKNGMVTAMTPEVAQIGRSILQNGGNAIDAAVAMAFAIDVAEPCMSGIGGGGFMTVQLANGEAHVVDFFPHAPSGATPDMYELTADFKADKLGFTGVKDNANAAGPRSVGVPGNVAGPLLALEKWGTRSIADTLAPAIQLARDGVPITFYDTLHASTVMPMLAKHPDTARIYLPNGLPPLPAQEGIARIKYPELAATLDRIALGGTKAFYEGEIAAKIVAELRSGGHAISKADLTNYTPIIRQPLISPLLGHELVLMPGPTGGPSIAEITHLMALADLKSLGYNSTDYVHRLIESCKLTLADRLAYMCESHPDGRAIPWRELASLEYAAQRGAAVGPNASASYTAGSPSGATLNPLPDHSCTTFLSAWDKDGNVVALTQTLNGLYGSGITVPGTGILLNNAMVLFDPRPGQPNSVAAGKRPLSSMSHTIVRNAAHQPVALTGAPGGRKIVDTTAQVLLNMIAFDMGPQAACEAAFIDPSTDGTVIDLRMGDDVIEHLRARGHKLYPQEATFWPRLAARPSAIKRIGDTLHGGIELFTVGIAAGY